MKLKILVIAGVLTSLVGQAVHASDIAALQRQAVRDRSSKEGYPYEEKFLNSITPTLSTAVARCSKSTPNTKGGQPAELVFVVGSDGHVKRVVFSKNNPFAECLAANLRGIPKVPRPPRDSWAVALDLHNRRHH